MSKKVKEETKVEKAEIVELTSDFKTLASVKKELQPEQMEFIKETIAPSLTPNEVALFLYRANIAKLDPLNGEMFAYASTKQGQRNLVMFAGRDGKRVAAERTGKVEYIEVEAIYVSPKGRRCDFWREGARLVGAEAKGKRSDKSREYVVRVNMTEYQQDRFIWKTKPETMIKKVAESQLLSMMFPNQLGGIYDSEAENFTNEEKTAPILKDGNKPATPEQIQTIQALDPDYSEEQIKTLSKQSAAEAIMGLSDQKKK